MSGRALERLRDVCVVFAALLATPALSQASPNFKTYTPRIEAARISVEEAPDIDGELSDPAWAKAAVIDEFYQIEPVEGASPSQPTRAYVMYDERHLYIAVYAYDSAPEKIRRNILDRDGPLFEDDTIRILLDPFGTFRDGFQFSANANGARSDALIQSSGFPRDAWNTIWTVKSKIVEDGWIAEFAIPFQSISFDASLEEWGFQITRSIKRHGEEIRWSNIDRSRRGHDLTNPGRLGGIDNVTSGIGLEAQLFVTGATSYDWELDESSYDLNPSANIFYKISPSLTGSLTFNTDFSDAPLDERQVNTGRFSLFFPETRDFFLQDAAAFEFGGDIFSNGGRNGLPFFSRRIGIVDGTPVDIVAGAKLSGKLGAASIGAVAAQTGAAGTIDGQFLTAARVSLPVLAESKAGFVLTHGDPAGEATNTVVGVDFLYKNSTTWPGTLTADFAYQRSFDGGVGDDMASGRVSYRDQTWNWNVSAQTIGENYQPRLGFVNRAGINHLNGRAGHTWRFEGSFIRQIDANIFANVTTDLDFTIEDREAGVFINARNDPGDQVRFRYSRGFTFVTESFDLAGEVPVAVGPYSTSKTRIEVDMTSSRPFSIGVEFETGRNFGGDVYSVETTLNFKPSRHLRFKGEYSYNDFSLPGGDIGIHVGVIESTIAFSPTMSIKTDIQYDNISEDFTFFSRFNWEPRPHQEVFLSFGHAAVIDRNDFPRAFRSQGSSFSLRLGHTLRL